jgi:hypothetical protein
MFHYVSLFWLEQIACQSFAPIVCACPPGSYSRKRDRNRWSKISNLISVWRAAKVRNRAVESLCASRHHRSMFFNRLCRAVFCQGMKWRRIPVAVTAMTTVGRIGRRIAATTEMASAIRSAGLLETKSGAGAFRSNTSRASKVSAILSPTFRCRS